MRIARKIPGHCSDAYVSVLHRRSALALYTGNVLLPPRSSNRHPPPSRDRKILAAATVLLAPLQTTRSDLRGKPRPSDRSRRSAPVSSLRRWTRDLEHFSSRFVSPLGSLATPLRLALFQK